MFAWLLGSLLVGVAVAVAGYQRHTAARRAAAHDAYIKATGWLEGMGRPYSESDAVCKAADIYKEKYGWARGREALKAFIRRYATIDFDRPFKDKPRRHAPSRIPDEDCEKCIRELRAGYTIGSNTYLFEDLDQAAMLCPTVSKYRALFSDCHQEGMWQCLCRYDPGLKHYKQTVKPILSDSIKQHRVQCCLSNLNELKRDPDFLKRVFWIDGSTFMMVPVAGTVIGHKDDKWGSLVAADPVYYYNCITHHRDIVKVVVYVMVNWYVGVCGYWMVQGTTGKDLMYRV